MEKNVKDIKKQEKLKKKEEKKKLKAEKKANKKPIDKMKLASRIIALFMLVLMVFSVCGTLVFYLLQN